MKFPFEMLHSIVSGHKIWKISAISCRLLDFFDPVEGRFSSAGGFPIDFSKTANIFPEKISTMLKASSKPILKS